MIKLYALPGSHPCAAVEQAMRLKSIPYKRIDLLPLSQVLVGPIRYGGGTVPGLRIGSERVHGSIAIMRRLDQLESEPALLPSDPELRQRVLEAELWGDEVLQSVPRRIIDAVFIRRPDVMESYAGDTKLPLPRPLLRPAMPLTARLMAVKNKAGDELVKADLNALPDQLQKIDGWIAEGLLGGPQPNAADLQIGSSIRLMQTIGDVAPLIAQHQATRLAEYFPPLAGATPAGVLPPSWLSQRASV